MQAASLETFERAGTPRQFVYAYQKTGFMPTTEEGRANRTDEENAEYDAAIDEYFDMMEPPVAEQSAHPNLNEIISIGQIETKLVEWIAELATHVGISIAVRDGIKWHDRTRDSEAIAKLVMHHANEEPILNSTTGKAKPKAAKLLFFDEGRKATEPAPIAQGYCFSPLGCRYWQAPVNSGGTNETTDNRCYDACGFEQLRDGGQ
jgi:hypothetical protein